MRFALHYRGPLRSNGDPAHKHHIRGAFHAQLAALWKREPLVDHEELLRPRPESGDYSLVREVLPFAFVPLVTQEMSIVAELSITLLRPEAPGRILTQGGDIDNRLKTLFDALTMPRHRESLPRGAIPTPEQIPHFFCLLEDDNLVTSVAVRTEQLLEPVSDKHVVDLLIDVSAFPTKRTFGNAAFG